MKAGLVDLSDDDRATLYGVFLTVADRLRGDERDNLMARWAEYLDRKGKDDAATASRAIPLRAVA